MKMMSNKIRFKWAIIILIFFTIVVSIFIVATFIIKKEAKLRFYIDKSDKYYTYDVDGKLDLIYGVRNKNQIDHLINYYNWKLNDKEYIYNDISVIRKLPNNTIVYAQKYLRDSSVVYVAFKHYNTYKKDSVIWNYYIPKDFLHKNPLDLNLK